jgi:hypothetical protein
MMASIIATGGLGSSQAALRAVWRKKIFSVRREMAPPVLNRARPTTGSDRGFARSNLTRYEFSTLWWNLHRLSCYIDNNAGTLVNYGARYHKGLPISSSIAESAVNQVVSHRMAKMPCANSSPSR